MLFFYEKEFVALQKIELILASKCRMMYVCDKILTDVLIMVLLTFDQIFKFPVKKSIVGSSSDILDVIAFMKTHYIFNQNS